jgi:hypothetical protein
MPCVFCDADGPLTLEHVFPDWLRPFLTIEGEHETGTQRRQIFRVGREVTDTSFPAAPATQTVRSVCAECNNGWMSQLEGRAKPYLETILRGHGRSYHREGRTLLATWLVKTALIAGSRFEPRLPGDFYRQLREDQQPSENTRVWLGATPYHGGLQYVDFRPIRTHDSEEPPPPAPNAYSALLAVSELVGFVVSWLDRVPPMTRLEEQFGLALVPI